MKDVLSSNWPHCMLQEIYQQPEVVAKCLERYGGVGIRDWQARIGEQESEIHILACGSSRHAGLVAQYWLEQLAGIPTRVRSASEFQEAPWPLTPNTLTIAVTQSGETADTLAALRLEKVRRAQSGHIQQSSWLGITNQPGSTLTQEVDHTLLTLAGSEIGVAATKTFTAQLVVFFCLTLDLAVQRRAIIEENLSQLLVALRQVPALMQQVLEQEKTIQDLAQQLVAAEHCILLGRGVNRAIALEGALKLKETTYLHAEGYSGGEFLHGPIALLDARVPVVTIVPNDSSSEVMLATVEKAKAHGSPAIGLVSQNLAAQTTSLFDSQIILPDLDYRLSPLLMVIPLQLLAYHIAVLRGLDVDRPRNITKTLA
ncbi:isomerizing glutamine--fructose-6-phosphate transaminase [Leptodesmis sp.]|uniref:isomerizing glutamine--fructose-6-phosphate transaminase n=1 Tax=Leptodesmis sp. TaxID=3100501 RepID=UPI0040534952